MSLANWQVGIFFFFIVDQRAPLMSTRELSDEMLEKNMEQIRKTVFFDQLAPSGKVEFMMMLFTRLAMEIQL